MNVKYYFRRENGYTETCEFNWLHYHEVRNRDSCISWKECKELFPGHLTPEQADMLIGYWNSDNHVYWWRSEDSLES